MAQVASVPGRENQFSVTLSRGDKAIRDGVDRHLVPLHWFDDPVAELADRFCAPVIEKQESIEPQFSEESLDVFEVALTDVGVEPYEPFYVVPFAVVSAEEIESEFDCFACYRAIPDPTGNEWESLDGVSYALVPEQGTLYVRQKDLVRKVSEVFTSDVKEQSMNFLLHGVIPHRFSKREFNDVDSVKESFMAMYFEE